MITYPITNHIQLFEKAISYSNFNSFFKLIRIIKQVIFICYFRSDNMKKMTLYGVRRRVWKNPAKMVNLNFGLSKLFFGRLFVVLS